MKLPRYISLTGTKACKQQCRGDYGTMLCSWNITALHSYISIQQF